MQCKNFPTYFQHFNAYYNFVFLDSQAICIFTCAVYANEHAHTNEKFIGWNGHACSGNMGSHMSQMNNTSLASRVEYNWSDAHHTRIDSKMEEKKKSWDQVYHAHSLCRNDFSIKKSHCNYITVWKHTVITNSFKDRVPSTIKSY